MSLIAFPMSLITTVQGPCSAEHHTFGLVFPARAAAALAASDIDTGAMISMANRLNELMAQQAVPRTHREVAAFFAGLDLVEPGLVRIPEWRPASVSESAVRAQMWGAIGRKP